MKRTHKSAITVFNNNLQKNKLYVGSFLSGNIICEQSTPSIGTRQTPTEKRSNMVPLYVECCTGPVFTKGLSQGLGVKLRLLSQVSAPKLLSRIL